MNKKKWVRYIETNVYDEAKKRIKHCMSVFDHLFVSFSWWKDSLATLKLYEECMEEEWRHNERIKVVFRDEEVIPDDVIEFIQEFAKNPKYEFRYFAVPMKSSKFILGKTMTYIQWDPNREWIRPKPANAITEVKWYEGRVFSQYDMDFVQTYWYSGKIGVLTGMRADESLIRFQSCISKKDENYINASKAPNVKLIKPIYDWSEDDIFKYFFDKKIKYCQIYNKQLWNWDSLRVATPLHQESAKRFNKLKTLYPVFYQQIMSIFPEMWLQDLYWDDYDRHWIIKKYKPTVESLVQFVKDTLKDEKQRKMAIDKLKVVLQTRQAKIKKWASKNLWWYPMYYLFKTVLDGGFKRNIMPQRDITPNDIAFEKDLYYSLNKWSK